MTAGVEQQARKFQDGQLLHWFWWGASVKAATKAANLGTGVLCNWEEKRDADNSVPPVLYQTYQGRGEVHSGLERRKAGSMGQTSPFLAHEWRGMHPPGSAVPKFGERQPWQVKGGRAERSELFQLTDSNYQREAGRYNASPILSISTIFSDDLERTLGRYTARSK